MKKTTGKKVWIIKNHYDKTTVIAAELEALCLAAGFIFDEKQPDIVISVGGDGTLLAALHYYETQLETVRFIGVHTGHLGFYADFQEHELDKLVDAIKHEDPSEAFRYPLLKVQIHFTDGSVKTHLALNESIIKRASKTLVADFKISDFLFEKFRGDGLSVSTPTGSTAYNKSIGGAVMHPRVKAFQVTEVASLNNLVYRTLGAPMIIAAKDTVTFVLEDADDYLLTVDQLEYFYDKIASVTYSLDGGEIAFVNGGHTGFWHRVKNAFIGEVK
ncbi:MAG: NAD kinase [Lactococcus sp.]|uniref:NAD kinase n=1 Tax=Pseudolactococcus piscium MKFS47 TaxID=297352 RepID=A0A0D6DV98_9LACT|nr:MULTISPECIES: NAD kinase [Lactococcus]MDN5403707.1 NAD kinase [Lactococcus sp.]MDN5409443.1 NAD kinase [Lactococcus sp.]MDN5412835.1 NAD kinase [Lactococcus sp.]MDN5436825.1 NAD kinase [Lactococcus sp.]MDN5461171.1 NAD kinase [Lactococcus sp.]